jgi:hypothetical protein
MMNYEVGGFATMNPMQVGRRVGSAPGLREIRPLAPALVEALRAEFLKLIEDPMFIERLSTIEQLAARGRDLAVTLGDLGGLTSPTGYSGVPLMPSVPYPNSEQFGARAIRELVGLAPDIASRVAKVFKSPEALINAIASAKEKGLDSLAAKLEAKLLASVDGEEEPAATVPAVEPCEHEHTNGAAVEVQP